MALSKEVLAAIDQVTPQQLAETRRWCELGDRVHLLSDLTEGRVNATPLTGKRIPSSTKSRRKKAESLSVPEAAMALPPAREQRRTQAVERIAGRPLTGRTVEPEADGVMGAIAR